MHVDMVYSDKSILLKADNTRHRNLNEPTR